MTIGLKMIFPLSLVWAFSSSPPAESVSRAQSAQPWGSNRSITARYRIKYDIGPDYSTPPNMEDFKFNLLHQIMMQMRDIFKPNRISKSLKLKKNYMAGFFINSEFCIHKKLSKTVFGKLPLNLDSKSCWNISLAFSNLNSA